MKLNLPAPAAALELDAVMVDLDGTMVNTLGDFAEALNRMLADLQLPAIAPQIIENMVGKGSEHLIRSVLAHGGAGHRCPVSPRLAAL
jgi:phosphoglycolate phosphatase